MRGFIQRKRGSRALRSSPALGLVVLLASAGLTTGCGSKRSSSTTPTQPGDSRQVTQEAKAQFERAAAFYREQAEQGWNESRCKAAADRFDDVADDFPELVEARFNAGLSYHHCEMYDAAEKRYRAALEIQEHGPSIANLGKIYWDRGDEARAREHWEKAVSVDQRSTAARTGLAWLIIREMREGADRRNFERLEQEASRHLSSVLAVENDNIEAYALYALLYLEGADRNRARLDIADLLLDEGSKIRNDYAPIYNARGLIQLKRDNVSQALANFQRAVALDPNFLEARMNVGNVVLGFRKYDEAVEQFQSVLQRDSSNYDALIGLGIAQRGLRQYDEAEKTYRRAVELDGDRGMAFFNLGVLYKDFYANQQGGDLKATQDAYRKARDYFRQYLQKNDVTDSGRREAQANIGDCDKIIEQLGEIIRAMAQQG
jgi:tetratricopeptide (TPR) repeat protein